ncbi:MAG: type II toxin-antitoxin system RelE/ParE family toxin [Candidatus Diapherotrites archaeon]
MFEVIASKKIQKQINPIDKKLKLKILDLFLKLKSSPVPVNEFNTAKISDSENKYRIRIQKIRIIYEVNWEQKRIEILKIDKRKDRTYKKI